MGNHDYFGEGEPLVSLLRDREVHVLRNQGVVLERDGARLFLAGIDDTWTKRADLELALAERPAGVPTVLLAHDPDRFRSAAERKVDVVLSGHTHGGQIAVPFLSRFANLSKFAHQFHIGLYEHGDSTLYVHGASARRARRSAWASPPRSRSSACARPERRVASPRLASEREGAEARRAIAGTTLRRRHIEDPPDHGRPRGALHRR